jgi:hypothetical protein
MAIRGIDNQIIVSKAHELSVDHSRSLHQHSNAALQIGQDQKKQVEEDAYTVLKLNKTEHKRVNVDEEKEKQQQQQKQKKKKRSLLGFEYYEEEPSGDTNDSTVSSRRFNASI